MISVHPLLVPVLRFMNNQLFYTYRFMNNHLPDEVLCQNFKAMALISAYQISKFYVRTSKRYNHLPDEV
jgi:hypothetical protein